MRKLTVPEITPEQEAAIWADCLFVFDTSALCRFYSLTESSKLHLIQLLEEIEDDIFIPARVKLEFDRHKTEEMQKQLGKYAVPKFVNDQHFPGEFKDFITRLRSQGHSHPSVPESTLDRWTKLQEEYLKLVESIQCSVKATFKQQKEQLQKQLTEDKIDKFVSQLPTGSPFPWARLMEIITEGSIRYANKIPPGYEDESQKTSVDRYGDLIIWKEIMQEAVRTGKNVVFITQDLKEDWNAATLPDSIVPREELLQEFRDQTGKEIWFYTISDFMKRRAEQSGLPEKDRMEMKTLLLELNLASIPDDCFKVVCPDCRHIFGIATDDILWDWETEAIEDRDMGPEVCHTVASSIWCPHCGCEHSLQIDIYEYPQGVVSQIELDTDLEVLRQPDILEFIDDFTLSTYEACAICGQWTVDLDDEGHCPDCRSHLAWQLRDG